MVPLSYHIYFILRCCCCCFSSPFSSFRCLYVVCTNVCRQVLCIHSYPSHWNAAQIRFDNSERETNRISELHKPNRIRNGIGQRYSAKKIIIRRNPPKWNPVLHSHLHPCNLRCGNEIVKSCAGSKPLNDMRLIWCLSKRPILWPPSIINQYWPEPIFIGRCIPTNLFY